MEHKHDCHKLLGSLSDYVDGDLVGELCAELERHLSDCENCRVVVDTLKKTVYLYHATTQSVEVPSEVRERLYKRLELDNFVRKA